jgi:hypothetical protein
MFAMPILLLFAATGLVILYSTPIQTAVHGDLMTIDRPTGATAVTLDEQQAAAEKANPGWAVSAVTPPQDSGRSTLFAKSNEDGSVRQVFVNPYTGTVLGSIKEGNDIVGLANWFHGQINNTAITVPLPTIPGILGDSDDGKVFQPVPVGEVILEILSHSAIVAREHGVTAVLATRIGTTTLHDGERYIVDGRTGLVTREYP